MPAVNFLFSTPDGICVEASPRDLRRPLILSLSDTHQALTLEDYFNTLKQFLLEEHRDKLLEAASLLLGRPGVTMEAISRIDICSEKLGAFYHIAAVRLHMDGTSCKLAVSTAFTRSGRICLERDFNIIRRLRDRTANHCLPRPFFIGSTRCNTSGHEFLMAVSEWLDGFHEWHFSIEPDTGNRRIALWDTYSEKHFVSPAEEQEIFRQIAMILTLCFDPETGSQVCQWHHAAGDFIVSRLQDRIRTRLTTVRNYQPILDGKGYRQEDVNLHLLFFFLDMTVRISMDRLDGVGEPVWVPRSLLPSVVTGFLHGLDQTEKDGKLGSGTTDEFISLLRSLSLNELHEIFQPLREIYSSENRTDRKLIASNLDTHVKNLYKTIQRV